MNNYNDQYSMVNSVHKLLVSHSIFPKSLKPSQFMDDVELKIKDDQDITDDYIKEITSKVIINHSIMEKGQEKVKNVLNGLNIFIVERDCNNFYDITCSVKNNYKGSDRAVVLMKEGGLYKPLMRKEDANVKGVFKMEDPMIEYLIQNGDII